MAAAAVPASPAAAAAPALNMARRDRCIYLKITAFAQALTALLHIDAASGRLAAADVHHHDPHAGRADQQAGAEPQKDIARRKGFL